MKKYIFLIIASSFLLSQCSKKDIVVTPPEELNNKSVGKSANDFLSAAKYNTINVQLQFMPGYAPDPRALDSLTAFLNTFINKPGGINISQTPIAGSGKTSLTLADINEIEKTNRTQFNTGNVLSVYVLFSDAAYATPNVLAIAYKNTSLVVFGPTVFANSGGVNQTTRTKLETTAERHEFGHLMGLTNLGTPLVTPHEDAAHPAHCDNNACLMYYTTQTTVMGGILLSGPIPGLDANCRADLRANGGK